MSGRRPIAMRRERELHPANAPRPLPSLSPAFPMNGWQVSDGQIVAMRREGERLHPAFSWSRHGGLAYNYTILWLCQRAVQLRGHLRSQPRPELRGRAANASHDAPDASACAVHAAGLPSARAEV